MRGFSLWLLRQLTSGLQQLTAFWCPMPPPGALSPRVVLKVLDAPPAGHPERMCRDLPLTRAEVLLMAEINSIGFPAE